MGNVKGNRYWEARLPKDFRRPPSGNPNPELASFIRAKYEDRAFAATDAPPPTIDNYLNHPYGADSMDSVHSPPAAPADAAAAPAPRPVGPDSASRTPTKPAPPPPAPALTVDLLGGFDEVPVRSGPTSPPAPPASTDPFGSFVSALPPPTPPPAAAPLVSQLDDSEWTSFHAAVPSASASSPALPTLQLPAPTAGAAAPLQHHAVLGASHHRSLSDGLTAANPAAGAFANQPSRFGGHSKALSSLPPELDQQRQPARHHVRTPSHETAVGFGSAHNHHHGNHHHRNHHANVNGGSGSGYESYSPAPDDLLAGLTIHQMMESMSPSAAAGSGVGTTGAAAVAAEDPFLFGSSAAPHGDALPHGRGGQHKARKEEALRLFDAEPSTGPSSSGAVGGGAGGGISSLSAMDDLFGDFTGSSAHPAGQNGVSHLQQQQQQHKQHQQLLI